MRVCRAGARGRKGPDEDDAAERDEVDNSDNKDAFRDSKSMIYDISIWGAAHLSQKPINAPFSVDG